MYTFPPSVNTYNMLNIMQLYLLRKRLKWYSFTKIKHIKIEEPTLEDHRTIMECNDFPSLRPNLCKSLRRTSGISTCTHLPPSVNIFYNMLYIMHLYLLRQRLKWYSFTKIKHIKIEEPTLEDHRTIMECNDFPSLRPNLCKSLRRTSGISTCTHLPPSVNIFYNMLYIMHLYLLRKRLKWYSFTNIKHIKIEEPTLEDHRTIMECNDFPSLRPNLCKSLRRTSGISTCTHLPPSVNIFYNMLYIMHLYLLRKRLKWYSFTKIKHIKIEEPTLEDHRTIMECNDFPSLRPNLCKSLRRTSGISTCTHLPPSVNIFYNMLYNASISPPAKTEMVFIHKTDNKKVSL